jgi:Uma2 family endonuclease
VVCAASDDASDLVEPTVVCKVLSLTTALPDRRVKTLEYAAVPCIRLYFLLEQDRREVTVMRRSVGWEPETFRGLDATLELPEVDVRVPLRVIPAP